MGKFYNVSLENIRGQNTATFNPHNKVSKYCYSTCYGDKETKIERKEETNPRQFKEDM